MDKGMNIFRIPFLMERLAQGTMTADLDATYLAALTTVVTYITGKGGYATIDPHNFGRYSGSVITSTSDFQTFWTNVATEFKSNDNVIFDCNNEFHDMPSNTLVAQLNQACIDGVRAAGATTQYVFVEGTVISSYLFISIMLIESSLTLEPGPGFLPGIVKAWGISLIHQTRLYMKCISTSTPTDLERPPLVFLAPLELSVSSQQPNGSKRTTRRV